MINMNKLEVDLLTVISDIAEENKYHITNCIRYEYLQEIGRWKE